MPSAASGATLAERAKRFLGLDLDTWLSGELKSDNSSAPANRSEQIAHAQRKHRQRTQSYIQALEEEVLRLRGVELSCKEEIAKLQEQLQSKLGNSQGQIEIPTPNVIINPQGEPEIPTFDEAQNGGISDSSTPETIMIDWEELYQMAPEPPCCIIAAEETPPAMPWTIGKDDVSQDQTSSVMWANAFSDLSLPEMNANAEATEEVIEINKTPLTAQMGVMHILQLERPCLSHLKHAMVSETVREGYLETPYNWGTNHAYNLSTRLVHDHKSHSSPQTTQITSSDLDSLLQASERLQLANELTPVQVWALVCKLNAIYPIDVMLISAMFEELSKYSYCNSFGSAISKDTIKAAFQHFLGWSHDF